MPDSHGGWGEVPAVSAPPDFNNLLAVLEKGKPARPTLFEFFLNGPLYRRLAGLPDPRWPAGLSNTLLAARAFEKAGYDYVTFHLPDFTFEAGAVHQQATRSLNEGAVISDRASFDAYRWPDPDAARYRVFDRLMLQLPKGMKIIVCGPGGVFENAIKLVGYEALCCMIADDEQLVFDVFEAIGSRLVQYYRKCIRHPAIGALIGNDDWGFKSQTMFAPADMRRFIFPWHKQIVEVAHAAGKPAILHSCGCLGAVMDDVIDGMKYDAKHSYEDAIQPVEEAYAQYHGRIAILGGMDVDFICRSEPEDVYDRSLRMLDLAASSGAYALGTGNSVPEYVPDDGYFAMIRAALDFRNT
jgi:uroporphyrinogen decarboxylase